MRNRAFGVEIECGYRGEGTHACTCECWCDEERRYMRQNIAHCHRVGRTPTYTLNDIITYECRICAYGDCQGDGCEPSYYDDELGCEEAAELLERNGFGDWLDGIHQDGSGVEIPSPILQGPQGMRDLQRVMSLLSDNGFYADTPDGLHVHHDAPEFAENPELLAYTVELWEENLDHIRRFVAPLRRNTRWAESRKERVTGASHHWSRFKDTKSLDDLPSWRTCAMNITPITNRYRGHDPNIELRLHEGTLDFRKAAAWIHFGQAFLDTAIKSYNKKRKVYTCASPLGVVRMTGLRGNSRRALMEVAALD